MTYTLPRFQDILAKAGAKQAVAKRVLFIWAIRDEGMFLPHHFIIKNVSESTLSRL